MCMAELLTRKGNDARPRRWGAFHWDLGQCGGPGVGGPDALTALTKAGSVGGGPGGGHTNHDTSLLLLPLARAMCASRARCITGWEGSAEGMGRVVKTTFRDTTKGRKRGGRRSKQPSFFIR